MSHPRLSICIPTYQRAGFLRQTLDCLLADLVLVPGEIELIISDNASTDETEAVIVEARARFARLRYHRNPVNLGAEKNFYRAVELAQGEYIWMLGDDDLIEPGFLRVLAEKLRRQPDLVVCNHSVSSHDFGLVLNPAFFSRHLPVEFGARDLVLASFGGGLGFISAVVFKRKLFFGVPRQEFEAFAEQGFSFLFAIYAGLSPRCCTLYIPEPLIRNRGANSSIRWETFFVDGLVIVFHALNRRGYSQWAVRRAKSLALKRYHLKYVLEQRINRPPAQELLRRLRAGYGDTACFWWMIWPLFLVPPVCLRVLREGLRRLRRRPAYSCNYS